MSDVVYWQHAPRKRDGNGSIPFSGGPASTRKTWFDSKRRVLSPPATRPRNVRK